MAAQLPPNFYEYGNDLAAFRNVAFDYDLLLHVGTADTFCTKG